MEIECEGIRFNFRRGFVAHVSLTSAAFLGGPCDCPGLNARIVHEQGVSWDDCPHCHGNGRTPGLAAELARAAPIERVTLTDKACVEGPHDMAPAWYRSSVPARDSLPPELFGLLQHGKLDGNWRWYAADGEEDVGVVRVAIIRANEDLSAGCVALARKRAGLPPLRT